MQDYWNDPPEYPEMPEWLATLEDVLDGMDPPQEIANVIRKAIDDWIEQDNKRYDLQPIEP